MVIKDKENALIIRPPIRETSILAKEDAARNNNDDNNDKALSCIPSFATSSFPKCIAEPILGKKETKLAKLALYSTLCSISPSAIAHSSLNLGFPLCRVHSRQAFRIRTVPSAGMPSPSRPSVPITSGLTRAIRPARGLTATTSPGSRLQAPGFGLHFPPSLLSVLLIQPRNGTRGDPRGQKDDR